MLLPCRGGFFRESLLFVPAGHLDDPHGVLAVAAALQLRRRPHLISAGEWVIIKKYDVNLGRSSGARRVRERMRLNRGKVRNVDLSAIRTHNRASELKIRGLARITANIGLAPCLAESGFGGSACGCSRCIIGGNGLVVGRESGRIRDVTQRRR